MSFNVSILTCSHRGRVVRDWSSILAERDVKPVFFSLDATDNPDEFVTGDIAGHFATVPQDIVVLQWHKNFGNYAHISRLASILEEVLNQGAILVHLFEYVKKSTSVVLNPLLRRVAPATIRETYKDVCESGKGRYDFSSFEICDSTLLDPEPLTRHGFVTTYTTLAPTDDAYENLRYGTDPVLLSKRVGNGISIGLGFAFCGSRNPEGHGLAALYSIAETLAKKD